VRTYSPKPGDIDPQWLVIDANDVVLGRLATHAADLLRGKHKPTFAPNADTGDYVIIVNAEKVVLTRNKLQTKKAYRHSGFPGGLKEKSYADFMEKAHHKVVEKSVFGMLPKNNLGPAVSK
jgi:large subunit ribosomal protein L13